MAAKKKTTTALATLNGDVSSSTLAKAGVEVKLTKTEIAEYIAAKATKVIEDEIQAINNKYSASKGNFRSGYVAVTHPPKRIANVVKAINAADGADEVEGTTKALVRFQGKEFSYSRGYNRWVITLNGCDILDYRLTEDETIPAEFEGLVADNKRLTELGKKLDELRRKNYKVLLVESVLSGSIAGATVLADLEKMVQDMVAAPIPA